MVLYISKKIQDTKNKRCFEVKDDCHYNGKYRGAADSLCNLRYQEQRDVPVIIHNGSNYNFDLIIEL